MSIHDGHRARLRTQLETGGLDSFSDVQVLELLLTYTIARRDVNPLAHALLDQFGSLSAVFDAAPADLQKLDGIGAQTALFLSLVPQLARRCALDRGRKTAILATTEDAGNYLRPYFTGAREECVYLLCLDAKCKVLDCRMVFRGSINLVNISVRKIVEVALQRGATSVILAHNHVSGIALPSREDERSTAQVKAALEPVGIFLADHIIVADDDFVSMADSGLLGR